MSRPHEDQEAPGGGGRVDGGNIAIPDDRYVVTYEYYETLKSFGNPKVAVHCVIIEPEQYAGTPIARYYNVESLSGPPKRYGNYKASPRGDLFREFQALMGAPHRRDRISFSSLRGKRLLADVRRVQRDHNREQLAEWDEYSIIGKFVGQAADEDW